LPNQRPERAQKMTLGVPKIERLSILKKIILHKIKRCTSSSITADQNNALPNNVIPNDVKAQQYTDNPMTITNPLNDIPIINNKTSSSTPDE
jgi:hypothetical protein